MSLSLICPGCQKKLKAPETLAGKKATCPSCRHQLDIPQEPTRPFALPLEPKQLSKANETSRDASTMERLRTSRFREGKAESSRAFTIALVLIPVTGLIAAILLLVWFEKSRQTARLAEAEARAEALFQDARNSIEHKNAADAIQKLESYTKDNNAAKKTEAARLLAELELVTPSDAALNALLKMSNDAFRQFRDTKRYDDRRISDPGVKTLWAELLVSAIPAAAKKREEFEAKRLHELRQREEERAARLARDRQQEERKRQQQLQADVDARKRKEVSVESAITSARPLRAPSAEETRQHSQAYNDFRNRLYAMGKNEFAFKDAGKAVLVSEFSLHDQSTTDVDDWHFVRANNYIHLEKYDFDTKAYSCRFFFWYTLEGATKVVPQETLDYCSLDCKIAMDEDQAQRCRKAYDANALSITVWYRMKRVVQAESEKDPHYTTPRQAYHLRYEIEVLKYKVSAE